MQRAALKQTPRREKEKARPVIPKTMRAAVVKKFREPLQIREVPVPSPGPGQALIQIMATGVCHTDLHAADGDWPVKPSPPFIPGHEGAGVVVKLGPGVTHLEVGDRVGLAWLHSACGHCEFCLTGWETLCHEQKNSGYSVNGSFAEYALGQADYLGRIPDQLSFVDAGPILCAGLTTYKGLKETEARPGEWVVISGAGGSGPHRHSVRQGDGTSCRRGRRGRRQAGLSRQAWRRHHRQREVTRSRWEDSKGDWRSSRRSRHRSLAHSLQTSGRDASSPRNVRAGWATAGRLSSLHLRCCA